MDRRDVEPGIGLHARQPRLRSLLCRDDDQPA